MKIELKSIKYSPSLSEETNAFTATLWVDGKKVADCRNDGRGGCTRIHVIGNANAVTPLFRAASEQALREIRAGKYDQPQEETEKMWGVGVESKYLLSVTAKEKFTLGQAIEFVVDALLEEHLKAKHMQKIVAKERKIAETWSKAGIRQMIRVEESGTVQWIPVQAPRQSDGVLDEVHAKHPTARVTVLSTWEAMGK